MSAALKRFPGSGKHQIDHNRERFHGEPAHPGVGKTIPRARLLSGGGSGEGMAATLAVPAPFETPRRPGRYQAGGERAVDPTGCVAPATVSATPG